MEPATVSATDTVSIRLLGTVEFGIGRQMVPLGGPRLRTLFGLLALRAPEVVSRGALIDGVWGGAPSRGAARTLRAHLARLRRCLDAARAGELIVTRAPGYALVVPPERVDVNQFEAGLEEGWRAVAVGAYGTSVRRLEAALRLWRGDLLADCVSGEWIRAERARLEQLRLHATEELLAARLAMGQHATAAAELERLVRRYPLRERLWELLMLALYRAGRQAEALYTYRRARSRLIEELAVEPGQRLRQLELAILTGDERVIGSAGPVGHLAMTR